MARPVPKTDKRLTNISPIKLSFEKLNSEKNPVLVNAITDGNNKTNENTKAERTVDETSISFDFTVVVLMA